MGTETPEQHDLRNAIEQVYQTFAAYTLGSIVAGCPDCVSPSEELSLAGGSLRAFTRQELERYSRKAMSTWGDANDYKHFLPRLLEILVDEGYSWDITNLTYNLGFAGYINWPEAERQALEAFCLAWWPVLLATFPGRENLKAYLCLFAHILDNIRPLLEELRARDTLATQRHLVQFCRDFSEVYAGLPLRNSFGGDWKDRPIQALQVADWMLEPSTGLQLGLAIEALEASGYASDLSGATWLKDVALYVMGT